MTNTNFSQTINVNDSSADKVYTLPDIGADANFVMTESNQTISGNTNFSGTAIVSGQSVFYDWIFL